MLVVGGILYPLSFGPVCWLTSQPFFPSVTASNCPMLMRINWPLGAMLNDPGIVGAFANAALADRILLGVSDGELVMVP